MSNRKLKKLRAKYGKLRVLEEQTIDGRRTAMVECTCGTRKRVLVDALTSGRTRSCGAYACKHGYNKVKVEKHYNPRGSRVIPLPVLRKIWARHSDKTRPITIASLAAKHKIEGVSTLYSALRAVRRAGGIDAYVKSVEP